MTGNLPTQERERRQALWDRGRRRNFVQIDLAIRDECEDWDTAALLSRIAYRCEKRGYWRATQEQVATECRISLRTLQRRAAWLRDNDWITVEASGGYDRTNVYRVVDLGTPDTAENEAPDLAHSTPPNLSVPSRQNGDIKPARTASSLTRETEVVEEKQEANGSSGEPLAVGQGRGSPLRPSDPSVTAAPSPPTEELSVAEKLMARAAPSYVVPRQVRAGLCRVIDELLSDGMAQAHVVEGLEEFWTRDRPHPRLLANLAMDAARDAATRESYYQTPEYQICKPDPVMLARMAQPYDPNEDD